MAELIPISHAEFSPGRLMMRGGGFWTSPRLVVDGREEPRGSRLIRVQNDSGKTVEIDCLYPFYDPIPIVKINGRPIFLAPPLSGFAKIWIALPLIGLGLAGGAIGGAFGAIATLANARIFRSSWTTSTKAIASALVFVASIILAWEVASEASDAIRRYFASAA